MSRIWIVLCIWTRLAKYETRIPWALLRLARLFDGLRKESLTFGAQTRWVLRSLVLACRFTSSLYQVLILQNFKDYKGTIDNKMRHVFPPPLYDASRT